MRFIVFLAALSAATAANGAERLVFFTAHFPDATSAELAVLGDSVSNGRDYDFEVTLGVTETDAAGAAKYADPSRHRVRVRCAEPAYVGVGSRTYAMGSLRNAPRSDWKASLWTMFCAVPSS